MAIKLKLKTPKIIKRIFRPIYSLYNLVWGRAKKSIRLELILIFGICLLISVVVGTLLGNIFHGDVQSARIDYISGMKRISEESNYIGDSIKQANLSINDKDRIQQILSNSSKNSRFKIVVCNLDGKVLYKSQNANETQIDIYTTIKNVMETVANRNTEYAYNTEELRNKEVVSFYPVNFSDDRGYVIVSGIPEGQIVYYRERNELTYMISIFITFLLVFYFITNNKMRYIETISNGLLEISKGNLSYRIERQGEDELTSLASNINDMTEELKNKIENERKVERTKNELITNVSHDLRTPLTSIKGYLGLIKEKRYMEGEQLQEFIDIAYNKSEKLEILINDLFEYTKLMGDKVILDKQSISLNGLLQQLIDELSPISEENNLTIEHQFINENVIVNVDPNKTVRVFENLLMNAIRYSLKPGKIEVTLAKEEDCALVNIKNKCEDLSKEELLRIFDRFYRVEKSRASDTGGSGLGLAIAKNIVELQGGSIKVEYKDGYISFTVRF